MITLIRTADGEPINVGDAVTVTLRGVAIAATVTELELPDPEFCGCVHLKGADGKEFHCDADAIGADWFYNGQPIKWDSEQSDREDFDSGRWTQADTDSMERGPDGPYFNEAGEPI